MTPFPQFQYIIEVSSCACFPGLTLRHWWSRLGPQSFATGLRFFLTNWFLQLTKPHHFYQLFYQLFINVLSTFFLSTFYQLLSTFYQLLSTFYQLFINFFINFLSTLTKIYQLLSTFYQLFINFLSTFYQLFINFYSIMYQLLSTFYQPLAMSLISGFSTSLSMSVIPLLIQENPNIIPLWRSCPKNLRPLDPGSSCHHCVGAWKAIMSEAAKWIFFKSNCPLYCHERGCSCCLLGPGQKGWHKHRVVN